MSYLKYAKLKDDIIAHASYFNPVQFTDINLLTYPLPSRIHRRYEALVVGNTPDGRTCRLAHAVHKHGEIAAMEALLGELQGQYAAQWGDECRVKRGGVVQMAEEVMVKMRNGLLESRVLMGLRSFMHRVGRSRYAKPKGGRENMQGVERSGEVSSGHGEVQARGALPNPLIEERTRSGAGRLEEHMEFQRVVARADELEESEVDIAHGTAQGLVNQNYSRTPFSTTHSAASHVDLAPHQPWYSQPASTLQQQNGFHDAVEEMPGACAPSVPQVSIEERRPRLNHQYIDAGNSEYVRSVRERRDQWEAMQRGDDGYAGRAGYSDGTERNTV